MHKHEILLRTQVFGAVPSLEAVTTAYLDTDELQEGLVKTCDQAAKLMSLPQIQPETEAEVDAVIYRVNDNTEYFVSKYFFMWPNAPMEPRPSRQRDRR